MPRKVRDVKQPLVYRVAPDKNLEKWKIVREGDKKPCAKGISKNKAIRIATDLAEKRAQPVFVLIHKTRYILERSLLFAH